MKISLIPKRKIAQEEAGIIRPPTSLDYYASVVENKLGEASPTTALSTHASATSTHGVAGVIVGTTSTQVLSNKTLNGATITDAANIVLNTGTGTKLGTAPTQKLGLYNATPVAQQTHIANAPAGGTGAAEGAWDTAAHRDEAIATINAILVRLELLGIVASA